MTMTYSSRQRYVEFRNKGLEADEEKDSKSQEKDDDRKKNRGHYFEQYRSWLAPYKLGLSFIFLLAVAAMLLEMVLPTATGKIIDEILMAEGLDRATKMTQLHLISAVILVALMGEHGIAAYRMYKMSILNSKIIFSLRKKLYGRLVRLPLGEIMELKTGGIVSRLSNDVDKVSGLMQSAIISPVVAFLKVIIILVILISINWKLALAAAAALPGMTYISYLWVKKGRPIYRSMAKDRSQVDARVAETFGGIRVVRSFRRERKEEFDYAIGHHTMIRKNILAGLFGIVINVGWSFFIPVASLIIVWFGGYLFLSDSVTIGQIVTFQLYSVLLLQPVWRIVFSLSETQRSLASMDRVFEVMDMKEDKRDKESAVAAPSHVENLSFENVRFNYKKDVQVLKGLNFEVKGGTITAFVGPSGAGKTTITDVIARFYDPTGGRVLLNGQDIKDFRLESFRSLFGIVQQEVFLFDGTIRENIAFGNPDASSDEIKVAAEKAYAAKFIEELPDGFDALIGERGIKLSGGQKQRLSIARAILADPQILILDEATSNLDSESEEYIQAALKELFVGRTTFVIAHRLSTITHADNIIVLEDGEIKETGKHDALMKKEGVYHTMVERQRKSFHF